MDVDFARIFTWGYDSKVAKLHSYPSQEGIFGHSENLLSDLVRLRADADSVSGDVSDWTAFCDIQILQYVQLWKRTDHLFRTAVL